MPGKTAKKPATKKTKAAKKNTTLVKAGTKQKKNILDTQDIRTWKTTTAVLAVFLVILLAGNVGTGGAGAISAASAKEIAGAFIKNSVTTGAEVEIDSIAKKGSVYELNLTVSANGQEAEFTSYMTLDGTLLFPSAMDMTKTEGRATQNQATEAKAYPKAEKPVLEVYTMSFCPYGQQANKVVEPVAKMLSSVATIEPHWVVYGTEYYRGQEASYCVGEICSMHGKYEVEEDIRQACVWKNYAGKYWDYANYIAENCNKANLDTCWTDGADSLGIDTTVIEMCAADEGEALLAKEKQLNDLNDVHGSESLLLNGEKVSMSDYRWSAEKLKAIVCDSFNNAPEICDSTIEETATVGAPAGGCGE